MQPTCQVICNHFQPLSQISVQQHTYQIICSPILSLSNIYVQLATSPIICSPILHRPICQSSSSPILPLHISNILPLFEMYSRFSNTQYKIALHFQLAQHSLPVTKFVNLWMKKSDQNAGLYGLNSQQIVC